MITGTKKWNKLEVFYIQDNNPTEAFLKATLGSRDEWLESCGPTAACNCLAAMGHNLKVVCPGDYKPQPEELLMDYFNDPRNKADLDMVRVVDADIPENRVPQYYPMGVRKVFKAKAKFMWGLSFIDVTTYVTKGFAVQICLKKPGHYLAVVAYDDEKVELVYNDSWNRRDGKSGWLRRMGRTEFRDNVQTYFIVYGID